MDIDGLIVKGRVVPVAESAHVFRVWLVSIVSILLLVLLLVLRSLLNTVFVSLCALRVNVCRNVYVLLLLLGLFT